MKKNQLFFREIRPPGNNSRKSTDFQVTRPGNRPKVKTKNTKKHIKNRKYISFHNFRVPSPGNWLISGYCYLEIGQCPGIVTQRPHFAKKT